MAVGIVAFNSITQPKNFADAEIVAKALLDFSAREFGVAVFIEKTRFAGEKRPRPIDLDRASFQNHPRIKNRDFQDLSNARRNDFIQVERRIFISPGIVIPIDDGELWIGLSG